MVEFDINAQLFAYKRQQLIDANKKRTEKLRIKKEERGRRFENAEAKKKAMKSFSSVVTPMLENIRDTHPQIKDLPKDKKDIVMYSSESKFGNFAGIFLLEWGAKLKPSEDDLALVATYEGLLSEYENPNIKERTKKRIKNKIRNMGSMDVLICDFNFLAVAIGRDYESQPYGARVLLYGSDEYYSLEDIMNSENEKLLHFMSGDRFVNPLTPGFSKALEKPYSFKDVTIPLDRLAGAIYYEVDPVLLGVYNKYKESLRPTEQAK